MLQWDRNNSPKKTLSSYGLWYTVHVHFVLMMMKQVRIFVPVVTLYMYIHEHCLSGKKKNFWFMNVVVTAFSIYTMKSTGIYCCESVSLFWLNTPLQSLNVTRNCFVFMTEVKWEVVSVALHTIWYLVMFFFCRCCC